MKTLTTKYKQQLKAKAHYLKPIILIGQHGLTEAVKKETDRALQDHELIKVRIRMEDREVRRALFTDICESLQAELVQLVGSIGVLYRKNED
jgi:RNA-binding protein